jgi:hypothetical protein
MLFVSAMSFPVFEDGLAESYFEGGAFARKGTARKDSLRRSQSDRGRDYAGRSEPRPYKGEDDRGNDTGEVDRGDETGRDDRTQHTAEDVRSGF